MSQWPGRRARLVLLAFVAGALLHIASAQWTRGGGEFLVADVASDIMYRFRIAVTPKSNLVGRHGILALGPGHVRAARGRSNAAGGAAAGEEGAWGRVGGGGREEAALQLPLCPAAVRYHSHTRTRLSPPASLTPSAARCCLLSPSSFYFLVMSRRCTSLRDTVTLSRPTSTTAPRPLSRSRTPCGARASSRA